MKASNVVIEMTLQGVVEVPEGLSIDFVRKFKKGEIKNIGDVDDFFRSYYSEMDFEPYLSEDKRLGSINIKDLYGNSISMEE